jgi:hypothetical protein
VRVLQWLTHFNRADPQGIAAWELGGGLALFPPWLSQFVPAYAPLAADPGACHLWTAHRHPGVKNYYPASPRSGGSRDERRCGIMAVYRYILSPFPFRSLWCSHLAVHFHLDDFLFGLSLPQPTVQPVTVALNNLAGSYIVEWNVQMAARCWLPCRPW